MPLNFWKDSADDGTNTNDSIQPIVNSEPVEEDSLNRAAQNLRNRTEDIRALVDDLQATNRSDRSFSVFCKADTKIVLDEPDPGSSPGEYRITLNDSGTPGTYNRHMMLGPMLSPYKDTSTAAVPARFYYGQDATNGISLTVDNVSGHPRKVSEGSHNIYWQLIKDASVAGDPVVEIKSNTPGDPTPDPEEGPVYIIVKIKTDNSTTLAEIGTAIDASAAGSLVSSSINGTGTTPVTLGGNVSWGPFRAYETDKNTTVVGHGAQAGVDDEGYVIEDSAFYDLFTTLGRRMKEGDTLFLDFANAKSRIQKTTALHFTDASNLHIISSDERLGTDSRNLGDADGPIPLFKVATPADASSAVTLVCLNQRSFTLGTADYLMNNKSSASVDDLRADLALQTGAADTGDLLVGAEAKTVDVLTVNAGTLNSQLKDIAKLGEQDGAATSGDNFVGAEAKSTADPTVTFDVPKGSVKSQLQSIIDQLSDSATPTEGAEKIGVIARTGSGVGKTLPAGPLSTDITTLLDYYDNHISNTAPADQHGIKTILDHPFIVVGNTNEADYDDLQTALNATFEGTIYLKKDAEDISLPTQAGRNLVIIGHNRPKISSNTAAALTFSGVDSRSIRFVNIDFEVPAGKTFSIISADFTSGTESSAWKGPTFEGCRFIKYPSDSIPAIKTQMSMRFSNCLFLSIVAVQNAGNIANLFEADHLSDGIAGVDIWCDHCHFENWSQIGILQSRATSNNTLRSFRISNSTIQKCGGDADDPATIPFLFDSSGKKVMQFQLTGNTFTQNSTNNAYFGAKLCRIGSGAIIENNFIDILPFKTDTPNTVPATPGGDDDALIYTSSAYLLEGTELATRSGSVISGNNIIMGGYNACAIRVVGGEQRVVGNQIYNWGWRYTSTPGGTNDLSCIRADCDDVVVSGNQINMAEDADGSRHRGISCEGGAGALKIVTGNTINMPVVSGWGIAIKGSNWCVSGNNIVGAGASSLGTGIDISDASDYCNVGNNIIKGFRTGISSHAGNSYGVISSNVCYGPGTDITGAQGIYAGGPAEGAITGNVLRNFKYGISALDITVAAVGNILTGNGTNYTGTMTSWGAGPLATDWPGDGTNYDFNTFNITALPV